jgi:hypothetical protein
VACRAYVDARVLLLAVFVVMRDLRVEVAKELQL